MRLSAPSQSAEPPRRRGWVPATRQPYLPLPLPASVYSGVYAVARGAGAELLESPLADLFSMTRNLRPAADLKPAAASAFAEGKAVAAGE